MMDTAPQQLNNDHAAFILGPVSIIAASHDANRVPDVTRALGCKLSADATQLTIFFALAQAEVLLANIRSNRAFAAVFSLPSTDQALQVKASDAVITSLETGDLERIERYHASMVAEILPFGFNLAMLQALFSVAGGCAAENIVAVRCTPTAIFEQTPGPNAGKPVPCVQR